MEPLSAVEHLPACMLRRKSVPGILSKWIPLLLPRLSIPEPLACSSVLEWREVVTSSTRKHACCHQPHVYDLADPAPVATTAAITSVPAKLTPSNCQVEFQTASWLKTGASSSLWHVGSEPLQASLRQIHRVSSGRSTHFCIHDPGNKSRYPSAHWRLSSPRRALGLNASTGLTTTTMWYADWLGQDAQSPPHSQDDSAGASPRRGAGPDQSGWAWGSRD
jgi:hypothetical protein